MTSGENGASSAGDVDKTSNSAAQPVTQTWIESNGSSETVGVRRADRPTTLSRPVQLPTCCNFRRQPWTTYVHGEFNYSPALRCYTGVDDELGAAADNEAVVKIIESLQIANKRPCVGNGYHGDAIDNPGAGEHVVYENGSGGCSESNRISNQTDSIDSTSHNARKSSPEIVGIQTTVIPLSYSMKVAHFGDGMLGVDAVAVGSGSQEHGKVVIYDSERSPTRQMRQDINQNLRRVDGTKEPVSVGPETDSHCQNGTGNSHHRPESPAATGRQQKCKTRRSRNRSLASRDERLTNGVAEPQQGRRISTRSRTLSPALTERFDYHVSRPVQTEPYKPEMARPVVTDSGSESSSVVCFRPGVHRKSRVAAASKNSTEQAVNGDSKTSSPAQSRR